MKTKELKDIVKNINTIDELNVLQENFNKIYAEQKSKLLVKEEASALGCDSYLFIKESFENMSEELFKTPKGKKIIGKYIKEHKSNPDLRKLFQIFENLSNADKTINVNSLIQEMKNIVGELNEQKINEGIKSVSEVLKTAYAYIGEKAKGMLAESKDVEEYVKYVFNNPLKMSNIVTYNQCINKIKSYVDLNEVRDIKLKHNSNLEESLKQYNELLSEENLEKDDYELIKEIKESTDKESVFEKYKSICLTAINEAIDNNISQSTCDKLMEFKGKINEKTYNPSTFGTDIANFIELKKLVEA